MEKVNSTKSCIENGSMQPFESIVKDYAENKRNEDIPNSTIEHAYIGVKYLLKNATGAVQILSGRFRAPFWSRFEESFKTFFATLSNKLEVIVIDDITDNQTARNLRTQYPRQVTFLHLLSDQIKQILPDKSAENLPHFMVIEPVGYRFERSDKDKQDALVKGIINFGDMEGSKTLVKAFNLLKEKVTEPVNL
jgi:hypothetical protein